MEWGLIQDHLIISSPSFLIYIYITWCMKWQISDQASFLTPSFPCRSNQQQAAKGKPSFLFYMIYLSYLCRSQVFFFSPLLLDVLAKRFMQVCLVSFILFIFLFLCHYLFWWFGRSGEVLNLTNEIYIFRYLQSCIKLWKLIYQQTLLSEYIGTTRAPLAIFRVLYLDKFLYD